MLSPASPGAGAAPTNTGAGRAALEASTYLRGKLPTDVESARRTGAALAATLVAQAQARIERGSAGDVTVFFYTDQPLRAEISSAVLDALRDAGLAVRAGAVANSHGVILPAPASDTA